MCKMILRGYDENDVTVVEILGKNYFSIGHREQSLSYFLKALLNKPIRNIAFLVLILVNILFMTLCQKVNFVSRIINACLN
jgi:hypothetical protein